ncbi:MAG: phosphoglycerate kinase, partial [Spirochaetales bacterium]|nr:phosphoglycerate kinase [Spirochaetales bacterium]
EPKRPCVFVLGGAKIADAFQMMKTVLSKGSADLVLTGGLVANIFLASQNVQIGQGSLDFILKSNYGQFIDVARELYDRFGDKIVLPSDLAWVSDGKRCEAAVGEIPADISAVDIGSRTAVRYREEILAAKTVFVNGPAGVFEQEPSELGTKTIWQALADTDAFTVLGGGDSITATEKYKLTDKIGYICTGGGALIRFLSGEELPVVRALRHGATIGEK